METLHVKFEGSEKELVLRTGDALPVREPSKVTISGDINTISAFLSKRKKPTEAGTQEILSDRTIVYTDKKNRTIRIDIDPENYFGAKVNGSLELSDELKQFAINIQSTYTRESLVKLFRFSKRHFDSAEVHLNVLTAYSAFRAQATTDHENSSDNRGNKKQLLDRQVTSNLPASFVLNIPIFKGQPKERFMVEICLELTDAGAHFWFESPELEELIALRTDEIFQKQLEHAEGLVIVNV